MHLLSSILILFTKYLWCYDVCGIESEQFFGQQSRNNVHKSLLDRTGPDHGSRSDSLTSHPPGDLLWSWITFVLVFVHQTCRITYKSSSAGRFHRPWRWSPNTILFFWLLNKGLHWIYGARDAKAKLILGWVGVSAPSDGGFLEDGAGDRRRVEQRGGGKA